MTIAGHPLLQRALTPTVLFLALFAVSRLAVSLLGIAPNTELIVEHWQNADLVLLRSDPFGTLWSLHSQPPLWNGMLALVVAFTGPDAAAAAHGVHAVHMAMSAAAGLMAMNVLRRMGFSERWSLALALAALCSPSVVYYENLGFYPHLTFFLMTSLVFLLTRIERGGSWRPVFGAMGVAIVLAWTWALFHPAFVAVLGVMLVLWRGADARSWAAMAAAVMLSALPSVKNAAMYGVPSASTWVGLNLMQTDVLATDAQEEYCGFVAAWESAVAAGSQDPHPGASAPRKQSGYPNLNHVGMIERSRECLGIAREHILSDIPAWVGGRVEALVRSHRLLPFNYDTDPAGWEGMAWLEEMQDSAGAVGHTFVLAIYMGLMVWGVRSAFTGPQRNLHFALMLTAGYFTAAAHFLNGGEQERMRYTIEPIYLLLTAGVVSALLSRREKRAPTTELRATT